MSFSSGFTGGFSVGNTFGSALRNNRLNDEIEALNDFGPVEIGAPEQPESEGALARGEPQTAKEYATRYQFGDKVYSSKPPQYEVDYAREQRRAELLRKKGEDSLAESVLSNAKTRYAAGGKEYYDELARRSQTLFYDDLGMPLPIEQILGDETRRTQALGILNDYAFEDVRNADGNFIRVKGFTPTPEGRFAMDLEVIDPKTGEVLRQAPVTRDRSSKAEDPVVLFTPETAFPRMLDHLRGKSATFADIDNKGRVYRGRQGLIEGLVVPETGAESYAPAPSTSAQTYAPAPSTSAQPQGLGGGRPSAPDVAENPSDLNFEVLETAPAAAPTGAAEKPVIAVEEQGRMVGDVLEGKRPSLADGLTYGGASKVVEAAEGALGSVDGYLEKAKHEGFITPLIKKAWEATFPTPKISDVITRPTDESVRAATLRAETQAPAPSAQPQAQAPALAPVPESRQSHAQIVTQTAEQSGVDPSLALRVAQIESNLNPRAVSPKGAQGLMQVMPATARDPGFGIQPARDASMEELTRVGVQYFGKMLERYDGDVTRALVAYNAGPGVADNLRSLEDAPAETRAYVKSFYSGQGVEPQGLSSAPRASGTYATTTRPSQRGLDAAVRMATHFPNELSVKDVEQYANTGRLADAQFVTDRKGGAAALDPYTGNVLWERSAPQTPVTAVEQAETSLKLEEQRYKTAQARMKTVDDLGKMYFGEDGWDADTAVAVTMTMEKLGIDPATRDIGPLMAIGKRNTKALEEDSRSWLGFGEPQLRFSTYHAGLAAAQVGMRETQTQDMKDRLIVPMQSIVKVVYGRDTVPAEQQYELMTSLGLLQQRHSLNPTEAAQVLITALRNRRSPDQVVDDFYDYKKAKGSNLSPSQYEQLLALNSRRAN